LYLNIILKALKGMAATFRVAQSKIVKTSAERRLPSTDSVLTMLKWIERHFSNRQPREDIDGNLSNNHQVSFGEIEMELNIPEKKIKTSN